MLLAASVMDFRGGSNGCKTLENIPVLSGKDKNFKGLLANHIIMEKHVIAGKYTLQYHSLTLYATREG